MNAEIHETALVSDSAQIGNDVSIGPYSVIGSNVKIGNGCKIHSHVVIDGLTSLGENNELFPFSSIGKAPQDLKFKGEPSTLEIGDNNKIREYVTMQPGTQHGNMRTIVGSNNLFMASSHVGHDCIIGSNIVVANSVGLAGHVTIEDNVILGGLCGVHQFTRVGRLSFISGGSMVGLDIPPFVIAQGDRCSLRGLNLIGLQRAGFDPSDIALIKKTFRHLFITRGRISSKIESLSTELKENEKVNQIINFIKESKRGITLARKSGSSGDVEENSS